MSVWDSVGSTYVDAVTSAVPIHRLVLFASGFIGAASVRSQTHLSVVETAINLKVADFLSTSSGPLAEATLGDVLIGVGTTLAAWVVARILLRGVFAGAEKTTDLRRRVQSASSMTVPMRDCSVIERQSEVVLLDSQLDNPRMRLRRLNILAEFASGIAFGSAVAFWWGNILDLIVAVGFILAALIIDVVAVRLFLAEYFGPALLKARLLGQQAPTPMDD